MTRNNNNNNKNNNNNGKIIFYLTLFTTIISILIYFILNNITSFDFFPSKTNENNLLMKGIVYYEHGGIDKLQYKTDLLQPKPSNSQILIHIYAAGLNPVDYKLRRNIVPEFIVPLPKIPGADIAGIVISTPKGSKFKPGDKVVAMLPFLGSHWGGYSEYVAISEKFVTYIPSNLTFIEAASLPLVGLTTLIGFDNIKQISSDSSVLIHAGSGGVGSFAIQWAKNVLKFKTVAISCSPKKNDFVNSLGADVTIDYNNISNDPNLMKNYDVVLDPLSYKYEKLSHLPGVIKSGGSYINILSSDFSLDKDGNEVGNDMINFLFRPILSQILKLFNPNILNYYTVTVYPDGEKLGRIMKEVENGNIKPIIDKVYPLHQAAEAQNYLSLGQAKGKVVLQIS